MKWNVNTEHIYIFLIIANFDHIHVLVSGKLPPGKFPLIKLPVVNSPRKIPIHKIPSRIFPAMFLNIPTRVFNFFCFFIIVITYKTVL